MLLFLKKHWFFMGLAAAVAAAFLFPAAGIFLKTHNILTGIIFIGFLITGLTLETASIGRQFKNQKVLWTALISSLILFPIIAYFPAKLIFLSPPDWAMGILILGVVPVTIASGTIMTAVALGNVPLSLLICVLTNLASILTIPFLLNLFLKFGDVPVTLPVARMLGELVIKVLLPTVLGQLLRPFLKKAIAPYRKAFSIFNQLIVLMILLNAVSSSVKSIIQAGTAVLAILLFAVVLHLLILAMNFGLSRLIRLDRASTSAFTIHTSQKTLTVSFIVWTGHFSALYPMALIPAISYHITQSIIDTLVAHRFRDKMISDSQAP